MENKKQRLLTCYHCGNKGLMTVAGEANEKFGGPIFDEADNIVDNEPIEDVHWYLLVCPVCRDVTLYKENDEEGYGYTQSEYCYPKITHEYNAVIPSNIKSAYDAALKIKDIDAPLCLIGLRMTLEQICKDKGAEGKDLYAMSKDLVDKNILPEMMEDACTIIRKLGNSAAHGDNITFYKYEVERSAELIGAVIDCIYVLPYKISRLKDHVDGKLKEHSEI